MTIEEHVEYRLLVKRAGEKRWKDNGRLAIQSQSVAQRRVENYRTEYGSTGWQFKIQARKVRIESTQWKDA